MVRGGGGITFRNAGGTAGCAGGAGGCCAEIDAADQTIEASNIAEVNRIFFESFRLPFRRPLGRHSAGLKSLSENPLLTTWRRVYRAMPPLATIADGGIKPPLQ
jgi:hypothetical protein